MIQAGCYNKLIADRVKPQGIYLVDDEGESILLPNRYVTENMIEGSEIEVFVYYDSEDRPVATTEQPNIMLHELAILEVKSVTNHGAFLDWGLPKDLFVPYAEQSKKMVEGEKHLVYLYHDEGTNRLAASNRLHKFFDNENITVRTGEEVELLVWHKTELGYKVIVNESHIGLVYHNEIFKAINSGDAIMGYVKQVREDNNIDISLQALGYKQLDRDATKVLNYIKGHNGSAPFTDKTNPEVIKETFNMSKKAFKRAIGNLFKQRLISIEKDGLKLVTGKSSPRRHKEGNHQAR